MNKPLENVKITFTKLDADKTHIDDVIVSGNEANCLLTILYAMTGEHY